MVWNVVVVHDDGAGHLLTAGPAGWNSTPVTAAAAVAVVGREGVAAGSSQRSSVTCRLNALVTTAFEAFLMRWCTCTRMYT